MSQNPKTSSTDTSRTEKLQQELIETRLKIEQAKLAKLEADLPKPTPQYTRYEDIPAPTIEEHDQFRKRLNALIEKI